MEWFWAVGAVKMYRAKNQTPNGVPADMIHPVTVYMIWECKNLGRAQMTLGKE